MKTIKIDSLKIVLPKGLDIVLPNVESSISVELSLAALTKINSIVNESGEVIEENILDYSESKRKKYKLNYINDTDVTIELSYNIGTKIDEVLLFVAAKNNTDCYFNGVDYNTIRNVFKYLINKGVLRIAVFPDYNSNISGNDISDISVDDVVEAFIEKAEIRDLDIAEDTFVDNGYELSDLFGLVFRMAKDVKPEKKGFISVFNNKKNRGVSFGQRQGRSRFHYLKFYDKFRELKSKGYLDKYALDCAFDYYKDRDRDRGVNIFEPKADSRCIENAYYDCDNDNVPDFLCEEQKKEPELYVLRTEINLRRKDDILDAGLPVNLKELLVLFDIDYEVNLKYIESILASLYRKYLSYYIKMEIERKTYNKEDLGRRENLTLIMLQYMFRTYVHPVIERELGDDYDYDDYVYEINKHINDMLYYMIAFLDSIHGRSERENKRRRTKWVDNMLFELRLRVKDETHPISLEELEASLSIKENMEKYPISFKRVMEAYYDIKLKNYGFGGLQKKD